jgi:hypothetical protein
MKDSALNLKAHSLVNVALDFCYSDKQKEKFHIDAKAYLNELAKRMNLPKGSYSVKSNKGGSAVLGEVTLHTDSIYVQLGGSCFNQSFMFRKCQSQKDYIGGTNNWMKYTDLIEKSTVAIIRQLQNPL